MSYFGSFSEKINSCIKVDSVNWRNAYESGYIEESYSCRVVPQCSYYIYLYAVIFILFFLN